MVVFYFQTEYFHNPATLVLVQKPTHTGNLPVLFYKHRNIWPVRACRRKLPHILSFGSFPILILVVLLNKNVQFCSANSGSYICLCVPGQAVAAGSRGQEQGIFDPL
ncbi:UNVERIFIED_CONTAM: hypothetical protein K2H54_030296 [Gekko kuhli]